MTAAAVAAISRQRRVPESPTALAAMVLTGLGVYHRGQGQRWRSRLEPVAANAKAEDGVKDATMRIFLEVK
jgi:hypothetical protein